MEDASIQSVPYPTIKRYPAYLQVLKELKSTGITTVSARDIAETPWAQSGSGTKGSGIFKP